MGSFGSSKLEVPEKLLDKSNLRTEYFFQIFKLVTHIIGRFDINDWISWRPSTSIE